MVTNLFLKRVADHAQSFVSDEIDDEVKFYTFHFRHQAEQRLQIERKNMENRRKEIISMVDRSESQFLESLYQMIKENLPIFAVIGCCNVGKTSFINYFTEDELQDRIALYLMKKGGSYNYYHISLGKNQKFLTRENSA